MATLEERTTARIKSIYAGQKRRAKKHGQEIPYTAAELVAACVPLGNCPYCGAHLTPKGFQIDHRLPLARGGSWALANCQPVCTPCNRRKHALTHDEFGYLLYVLSNLDDYARRNILARLAAGGAWLATRSKVLSG